MVEGTEREGPGRWRLLANRPGSPAWNMAVDEALLIHCGRGEAPPTLRFYTWEPAAVSLGGCQDIRAEIDREACRRLGVGWVRRPTGGRAVFHGADLTYSVAAPGEILPGGVLAVYRRLAEGLLAGLRRLGVPAELVSRPGRGGATPGGGLAGAGPCFMAPSWWEVTVGGRKLVGSAQARRRGAVLQHGSIPLEPWSERFCAVLKMSGEEARRRTQNALDLSTTFLGAVLAEPPSVGGVAAALCAGFAEALGIELYDAGLTPDEVDTARRLMVDRYWPEADTRSGLGEDLPQGARISGCSAFRAGLLGP